MYVVDHGLRSLLVGMRSVKDGVVVLELAISSQLGFTTLAVRCWQVSTLGVGDEMEAGREGNRDCIWGESYSNKI
jgi:hypothetical protein